MLKKILILAVVLLPGSLLQGQSFPVNTKSGDLVINEFMADNDNISADPAGEYDDWIELYNKSADVINLEGYFLTDDMTEMAKWSFPDTSIAAESYLIIWADDDTDQEGLHANFKLSASGEEIYLSMPDTTILDEITFGEQETDLSYGRYPDGTGEFIVMTPSFSAANVNGITSVDDAGVEIPADISLAQNYPNPFNPETTIKYFLPQKSMVTLKIFNTLGEVVRTLREGMESSGMKTAVWNGTDDAGKKVSSGHYIYQLKTNGFLESRKMILLK